MIFVMKCYLRGLILVEIWRSHHKKSKFSFELSFWIYKWCGWTLNSILILNILNNYWFFNFVILFFRLNIIWIIISKFFFEILCIIFNSSSTCWFLMHTYILTFILNLFVSPFVSILNSAFEFIINQWNLTALKVPLILNCGFHIHVGIVKIIRCQFIILVVNVVACHQQKIIVCVPTRWKLCEVVYCDICLTFTCRIDIIYLRIYIFILTFFYYFLNLGTL